MSQKNLELFFTFSYLYQACFRMVHSSWYDFSDINVKLLKYYNEFIFLFSIIIHNLLSWHLLVGSTERNRKERILHFLFLSRCVVFLPLFASKVKVHWVMFASGIQSNSFFPRSTFNKFCSPQIHLFALN